MNRTRKTVGARRATTGLRLTGMIMCLLALALIPAAAMAAVQVGPVVNPANGHQYYLLSQNTWTGAEAEAIGMGGHLVTINDGAENTWVWNTFAPYGHPLWIGLSDAAQEGTFVWASGEAATYFNWWGSEPNNLGGVEHYVEMNNLVWNDNINGQSFLAVVEVQAGTGSILSALADAIDAINHLAPESFKNGNDPLAKALTNKIDSAIQMIDHGLYADALDKLQNDIIAKTDGCANTGAPDKNDWITNCTAQGQVYPFILEAIDMLQLL